MANKKLFESKKGPDTDTVNEAGGTAYAYTKEHALAQYACTGCLNRTFYARDEEQLQNTLELCNGCSEEFIAKTAVYARERGFMKDMPALLCAVLASRGDEGLRYLKMIFPRVIDNAKMLRNFVQIIRSGAVGRKSFGTAVKKLIVSWLNNHNDHAIFRGTVGNDPSLADIIKMVHPKPLTPSRDALYAYILGKEHKAEDLPPLVKEFEEFKELYSKVENDEFYGERLAPPAVPFQMISGLPGIPTEVWAQIARDGGWHMVRMNLNTFKRHGVYGVPGMVDEIVRKLTDREAIAKARVFPYQLLMAYLMVGDVPHEIQEALQDAMEAAVDNVPSFGGKVIVCPDTSGSMSSPVTGYRRGATTKVECVHVAGLVTAAILRKNPDARALPARFIPSKSPGSVLAVPGVP